MQKEQQILATVDKIVELANNLKVMLNDYRSQPAAITVAPQPKIKPVEENISDFEFLRKALENNKWPEAVNPHLLCDPSSEADKIERGRGIIELMVEDEIKNSKFLDFGCGDGHCAFLSSDYQTNISVGYDFKTYDSWKNFLNKPNLIFTHNYDKVIEHGPYDIIIFFDVLDHLQFDDPVSILKKLRNVLADKGKIYMRAHPFTSRHGTHLYHDLNKAYVHLVFTPDELAQILPQTKREEPSLGVTTPINTYEEFIAKAGLVVKTRKEVVENIEPFFKIPKIAERIIKKTKMGSFPEYQMSLQFIDYVLTKD